MDVSPAITDIGDEVLPAEQDEDEEYLCRICRSPEEPGNPLRYPCSCRGSIKYVHEECLRLWRNRRGHKKCEVCGPSYSIVPVYSENAPEKLPCHEFLIGVLLKVSGCMKWTVPWIVVLLLNTCLYSLHPWGQETVVEFQRHYGMSLKLAYLSSGLIYTILIDSFMTFMIHLRMVVECIIAWRFPGGFHAENFFGSGLGVGFICGVVKVLWKYMKILCDWYFVKVMRLFGGRHGLVVVPFHEFGAIRVLFSCVDDNAFAVLAISIYVSFLFVLLPLWVGRIVLATVGGSYLSGNSPVIVGYMMMMSISFGYFGILFTLHQNVVPKIYRWLTLGLHFIAVLLPFFLCSLLVIACKNLYVIKDAFVLFLKFGVLPWIIGCWLEICISPMFGATIPQNFEVLSRNLVLMNLQWLGGFLCLMVAHFHMYLIQEVIHNRAFWYILDVTDPDYKITKLNLGHTVFVLASHGVLLVISFHLPIKAVTFISPSFFPLQFWVTDVKSFIGAYPIYFLLMSSSLKGLKNLILPAIELIVHKWIITVSFWLQLSDFLLVRKEGLNHANQNVRPLLQPRRQSNGDDIWFLWYAIGEGSMVILHEPQHVEDDIKDQRDNWFVPRIALMLVLAALSLFLFSTTFMTLPILVGRVFFGFIMLRDGLKHDDLCRFWIGCYILRAIYITTCFVSDNIHKGRVDLLVKCVSIWIRNGLLFFIWIFVIPGLLGLLIDLMIIIPLRVPLNESPAYYLLIQDWLIGVVVLHIWIFLTMQTPINWLATEAWRGKLERIENVGINRLPLMWLLRDVFGSIIITLITTLCIPYLLLKSLLPLLGFSESINSAVERLIWPALLALTMAWFMIKLTRDLIIHLHQLVFNERYLVGERVDNLIEDREQRMTKSMEYDQQ